MRLLIGLTGDEVKKSDEKMTKIELQRRTDEILDREERSREPYGLISWGRQRAQR